MTDEHKVSATQIATWRLCRRKWGWRHLDGYDAPSGRSAQLGSAVHQVLEDHLNGLPWPGDDDKHARILLPALEHLPEPGEADAEADFDYPRHGVLYTGRIDVNTGNPEVTARFGAPEGYLVVWDLKTTSDFKWAREEEELRRDAQVVLYAACMLAANPEAKGVLSRWVYARTRGAPSSMYREILLSREDVEEAMAAVDADAAEILRTKIAGGTTLEVLEANPRACRAFGGCPYEELCDLSAEERLIGIMSQGSLIDQMKARAAELKTITVEEPPTPGEAPALPTPAAAPLPAPEEAINPPEGPKVAPTPAPAPVVSIAAGKPAAAPAEPSKSTAKRLAASKATKAAAPPTGPGPAPVRQGFTLYVDCWPIRTSKVVLPLEQLVAPITEQIEEETGMPDYRLVEFGRGPAMYSAAVKAYMNRNPIGEQFAVVLNTRAAEGQHALSVLRALAAEVVVGT